MRFRYHRLTVYVHLNTFTYYICIARRGGEAREVKTVKLLFKWRRNKYWNKMPYCCWNERDKIKFLGRVRVEGSYIGVAEPSLRFARTWFCGQVVPLDWWPLTRDCLAYGVTVALMICIIHDERVEWYEALTLVLLYIVYIAGKDFQLYTHLLLINCISEVKLHLTVTRLWKIKCQLWLLD